jgi:hypothetical protein
MVPHWYVQEGEKGKAKMFDRSGGRVGRRVPQTRLLAGGASVKKS